MSGTSCQLVSLFVLVFSFFDLVCDPLIWLTAKRQLRDPLRNTFCAVEKAQESSEYCARMPPSNTQVMIISLIIFDLLTFRNNKIWGYFRTAETFANSCLLRLNV